MKYETLKPVVDEIRGSTFASIDTKTEVKLTGGKKNPMQGRVTKETYGANIMLFAGTDQNGYANMIKRRLADEGKDPESFVLGSRAWGTRIDQSPFIQHNDKYYLEAIFINPGKSVYFLDGKEIAKEDIEGLGEKKDSEESQAGLDKKVVVRTFSLDSIMKARLKGVTLE